MAPKRKKLFESTPAVKKSKTAITSRAAIPSVADLNFSSDSKTENGDMWNFKVASWNVNGIRAWAEKNGHSYIPAENPDIICLQETKCDEKNIPENVKINGYNMFWNSADKGGYSGTAIYSKVEPIKVTKGLGIKKHDNEGRVITAEFEKFYFVTTYVPNSGQGLVRLDYRVSEWDVDFHDYLVGLEREKPVILCGDLNVSYLDIDIANPKSNQKSAGFTKEERESFGKLLNKSFVDSFRHLYPTKTGMYSYWSYMGNARSKNVGWRLDYCMVSSSLKPAICDSVMRKDVMGSDHCPVVLFLHL
ncbi:hypothetical protein HELRODRAFT_186002 [Helobdella robusta]|uniref:DNA repair nuclease/redox regulator APEX1 n=1 Tax=Helobdella robusta TaxID=6412 RepID=T1FNJ2_HELRO|nr:hypothetical protein HELRODRAFT_186002 [Helobdella robusta]ESN95109.1 hypothetical protein HELRODRAFT_186002 [Helobdella robusta]